MKEIKGMTFEQFQWLVGFASLADVIYSAARRDPKQVVRSLLLAGAVVFICGGAKFDKPASAASVAINAPERRAPEPVAAPIAIRPVDRQWFIDHDRTTYGRYYVTCFQMLDSSPQFPAGHVRAGGSDADGQQRQVSQFHLTNLNH